MSIEIRLNPSNFLLKSYWLYPMIALYVANLYLAFGLTGCRLQRAEHC